MNLALDIEIFGYISLVFLVVVVVIGGIIQHRVDKNTDNSDKIKQEFYSNNQTFKNNKKMFDYLSDATDPESSYSHLYFHNE